MQQAVEQGVTAEVLGADFVPGVQRQQVDAAYQAFAQAAEAERVDMVAEAVDALLVQVVVRIGADIDQQQQ